MTDNDFLYTVLEDGGWHGQAEILARSMTDRGHGLTVHSRAADLRKRGHIVECELRHNGNGRALSFYRLVTLDEASASDAVPGGAVSDSAAGASSSVPASPQPPAEPQTPAAIAFPVEDQAGTLPLFACDIDESAGLRGAYGNEAA